MAPSYFDVILIPSECIRLISIGFGASYEAHAYKTRFWGDSTDTNFVIPPSGGDTRTSGAMIIAI